MSQKKREKKYHLITFYTPIISPVDYELSFAGIMARIVEIGDNFYFLKTFFKDKNGNYNSFNMYIPYVNIAGMTELKESSEKFEPEDDEDGEDSEKPNNVINFYKVKKDE
jgi:hypothetical protein